MHFYGPGYKSLENALRSYMGCERHRRYALAINPNNNKWYIIIVS